MAALVIINNYSTHAHLEWVRVIETFSTIESSEMFIISHVLEVNIQTMFGQ